MTETEKIEWVYSRLEDEESKYIFEKKIKFNKTGDYRYIGEIIDKYIPELSDYKWSPETDRDLVRFIKERNKQVIIYGAGWCGLNALKVCKSAGISVAYFCDGDVQKQKTKVNDEITVISPQELAERNLITDCVIVISPRFAYREIKEMLSRLGVPDSNTYRFIDHAFNSTEQYFDAIIRYQKKEVFVDGGCCDFETSRLFLQRARDAGADCRKIYAYEPDKENFRKCKDNIEKLGLDFVSLVPAGLWSEDTNLCFLAQGNGASHLMPAGGDCSDAVRVVALDSNITEKVTYIKMDIEGAELEALKGAQNIILRDRPKLAICLYHKKEDMWEIPYYIKTLLPEYKLYIRHYSNYECETVLYAVCG